MWTQISIRHGHVPRGTRDTVDHTRRLYHSLFILLSLLSKNVNVYAYACKLSIQTLQKEMFSILLLLLQLLCSRTLPHCMTLHDRVGVYIYTLDLIYR